VLFNVPCTTRHKLVAPEGVGSTSPVWLHRVEGGPFLWGKANGHPSDLEPSVTRFCNRSICSGASPSPSDLFCRVHLSCSFWHGPTCRHWFFVFWKMRTGFWMHLTDEAISSSPPRIEPGEAIRIRVISPLPSYVIWFLDASHGWGYFIFSPRIESGEAILAFWVIFPLLSYVTPVDLSVLHEFCDYLTLFLMMLVVIFHLTQLSFSARIYVFWMCRFMCLLWFVASFPPG